jgi:hypothetical protein
MEALVGVAGIFIGWAITHAYYRRGDAALRKLFGDLTRGVIKAVLHDQRSRMSVADLSMLLEKLTIDENSIAPLPYKACPQCGSTNLKFESGTHYDHDEVYHRVKCSKCVWGDWTQ